MQRGEDFVGFNEAPINFPPTFKYDVQRTLKKRKRRSSRLHNWRYSTEKVNRLTEVEEKELEEQLDDDDAEEECDGEVTSVASSVWTSVHSRPGTDVEDDDYFNAGSSPPASNTPGSRVSFSVAANKAKAKWMALIAPPTPNTSTKMAKASQGFSEPRLTLNGKEYTPSSSTDVVADVQPSSASTPSLDTGHKTFLRPLALAHSSSTRSNIHSDEEDDGDEKGVYDSSHKKRVPSW